MPRRRERNREETAGSPLSFPLAWKARTVIEEVLQVRYLSKTATSLSNTPFSKSPRPRTQLEYSNAAQAISRLAICIFLCAECGNVAGNLGDIRNHACPGGSGKPVASLEPDSYQVSVSLITQAVLLLETSTKFDATKTKHSDDQSLGKFETFSCLRKGCANSLGSTARTFEQMVSLSPHSTSLLFSIF